MDLRFPDYPFTKMLGWSNSRYDLFCQCKRKYLYFYYPASFANLEAKVKELKKLTTIPLEIGNLYHDMMEVFLERLQKSDSPINEEKLFGFVDDLCEKKLSQKVFFENYYKTCTVDFGKINEKVKFCMKNFLISPILNFLNSIEMPQRQSFLIEAGSKMNGKKYFGETRINGLKAFCKMDFIFIRDEKVYIIDWKTGKKDENKHTKQLLAYALAAKGLNSEIKSGEIFPKSVYVSETYGELALEATDEKLADFAESVRNETEEMQSFCLNVEENIPLPVESFEKTPNESVCKMCEFRELCFI
ncbi:MAG: PD-(D/E)XK nuclease family protein [Chitinispirillales bacterium]|jgi:CRISPR/Cas system-associated exonuclease Cas4 (RecB family)|nr:PD-(D/E)XK nuclease family protein [Chitinispirillales bacterium]